MSTPSHTVLLTILLLRIALTVSTLEVPKLDVEKLVSISIYSLNCTMYTYKYIVYITTNDDILAHI